MKTIHCFLLALLFAATTAAQPVYETRDDDGPVFSDLPSDGSREMVLPPIDAASPLPAAPVQPAAAAVAVPYQALSISEPESGGTVHSNTGQIPVRVSITPALRAAQGDVLVVSLDKTALPTMRSTLQFDVSAAEWQLAAVDSVEHELQVSVIALSGKVLITSAPVRFYVHRASQLTPTRRE